MQKIILENDATLLEAARLLLPESSNSNIRLWIKQGRLLVDGKPAPHPGAQIKKGQELCFGQRSHYIKGNLRILFEDHDLVVVEKPTGLLSVSSNFEKDKTIHGHLKAHYKKTVYPVHRLDQDTSGVMVFALSERGRDEMKKIFEKHDIERIYIGVVEGRPDPSAGTWRSYQYEDPNYYVHNTDDPAQGKEAITHYKVLEAFPRYSLVQFTLETGRKNQIRAHCEHFEHPIAGDKKYGARSNPLKRLGLHASHLSFIHPFTGKKMSFSSETPALFVEKWRKPSG